MLNLIIFNKKLILNEDKLQNLLRKSFSIIVILLHHDCCLHNATKSAVICSAYSAGKVRHISYIDAKMLP